MEQLIESLKNFGVVRLAVVAALIIGMGSGMHYLTSRLGDPEMALLYANLDLADAGKIVSKLESTGVEAEIRGGGTEVYVPASKVARLRMEMAEAGLPRGGSMGYELFDKTDSLGTSGFVQDINHVRALEGEIARTISTLAQVESARVHLVLPRRELFSRDRQEPSASIMLRLQGPGKLQQSRVQAIQHLVASAVPGLVPEKVSIVDDRGNLLARGDSNADITSAATLEEMRLAQENRLSQTIESLLEKHVGMGKVRAEVSMQMDMDRTTENSEEYNPDGQVVRSQQTVEEGDSSTEGGAVTANVQNAQPGAGAGAGGGGGKSSSNRKEETVNYEISKKIKTFVKETGTVKKLSVAVMVDGTYKGEGKDAKYEARTPEEMKQLKTLVQNAIGYNEERGDKVEVINMQFAPVDVSSAEESSDSFLSFTHPDIVRLIESLIIGVMGLLMLLMVIKPLLVRLLESLVPSKALVPAFEGNALPGGAQPALANHMIAPENNMASPAANYGGTPPLQAAQNQDALALEKMINLQQIEGQVRESTLKTVSGIIDSKPEEAVNVVRGWMQERG